MTNKQLQKHILNIISTYTPMIGAVPLKLLQHHLIRITQKNITTPQIKKELNELEKNKQVWKTTAYQTKPYYEIHKTEWRKK